VILFWLDAVQGWAVAFSDKPGASLNCRFVSLRVHYAMNVSDALLPDSKEEHRTSWFFSALASRLMAPLRWALLLCFVVAKRVLSACCADLSGFHCCSVQTVGPAVDRADRRPGSSGKSPFVVIIKQLAEQRPAEDLDLAARCLLTARITLPEATDYRLAFMIHPLRAWSIRRALPRSEPTCMPANRIFLAVMAVRRAG